MVLEAAAAVKKFTLTIFANLRPAHNKVFKIVSVDIIFRGPLGKELTIFFSNRIFQNFTLLVISKYFIGKN